jgi:hypothetical protein
VRYRRAVWLSLLVVTVLGSEVRGAPQASSDQKVIGTWAGTWEGAGGSGNLEVILDKADAAMTGAVAVFGEPAYKATFKTLKFEDGKMTATYDYPPEPNVEVVLTASFAGAECTGTWAAREKASNNEVASGTWKAKKKE